MSAGRGTSTKVPSNLKDKIHNDVNPTADPKFIFSQQRTQVSEGQYEKAAIIQYATLAKQEELAKTSQSAKM